MGLLKVCIESILSFDATVFPLCSQRSQKGSFTSCFWNAYNQRKHSKKDLGPCFFSLYPVAVTFSKSRRILIDNYVQLRLCTRMCVLFSADICVRPELLGVFNTIISRWPSIGRASVVLAIDSIVRIGLMQISW